MSLSDLILRLRLDANTEAAVAELGKAGAEIKRLGTESSKAGRLGADAQKLVGRESNLATGQVGNLVAQLNDVGIMLAAGQNPLQLAIQQGSQITQVIGPMGAAGAVRALGTAFMSLLSPVNLVTLGGIAAGAALVQWLAGGEEKAKSFEDALDDLAAGMDRYAKAAKAAQADTEDLRAKFGDATEEARVLLQEIAESERRKMEIEIRATVARAPADTVDDEGLFQAKAPLHMSEFFDLPMEGNGRVRRAQEAVQEVIQGYKDLGAAADASTAEQIAALEQLTASFERAARASGSITGEENDRLLVLQQLLAKLYELQALEDAGPRADRAKAGEIDADLRQKAAIEEAIAKHGEASAEVENLRIGYARELFQKKVDQLQVEEQIKAELRAQWEAANPSRDPYQERINRSRAYYAQSRQQSDEARTEAEKMLADLERENALKEAILRHGEGSVEVARLRAEAEREAKEAQIEALPVSEDQKELLREAFEHGQALANLDLASGIGAGADEAARLADWLGISVESAVTLARLGPQGAPGSTPTGGRGDPREFGGSIDDWQNRDATVFLENWRPPRSARSGRGGDRESFAALQQDAEKAMAALQFAIAAINEKVRAGLITTAEGQEAVRSATEATADQIAGLIPRLEQAAETAGPGAAAKIAEMRTALKGLSDDLGGVARDLSKTFADSLGGAMTDFIGGTKTAGDAFADFATTVLGQINRIVAQRFANAFITPLVDSLLSFLPFAQGGVPGQADLSRWSDTVDDKPIAFPIPGRPGQVGIAREAGKEAILPVRQGAGGEGVLATDGHGHQSVVPLERTASGALGVRIPSLADRVPELRGLSRRGGAAAATGGVPPVPAILSRPTFFAQGGTIGRILGSAPVGSTRDGDDGRRAVPGFAPSAGTTQVTVNVNNTAPNTRATATERPDGQGGRLIEVLVEQIEGAIAGNVTRGVGPLADVLGQSFGLARQPR